MTRVEAHQLLDAARSGVEVSHAGITAALQATGDIAPLRLFDRHGKRVSLAAPRPLPSALLPVDPPAPQVPRIAPRLRTLPYHRLPEAA